MWKLSFDLYPYANWLNPIMNKIVSPEQGGFVEGLYILDDIILTHESIHSLKMRNNSGMLINLNMPINYDCISWTFLHEMLDTFGFYMDLIHLIKKMIYSTLFSILINGIHSFSFNPSRGILQGYPLSPFFNYQISE